MDRSKIIKNLQKNKAESVPLPEPFIPGEGKRDKLALFKEMLYQTGGRCVEVNSLEELDIFLEEHFPDAADIRKKEIFDTYSATCPKEKLERLGTVILKGEFGVAENGAVWIDDHNFPNRLIPFIVEKLVLYLDSGELLNDMHEAYSRLKIEKTGFGLFLSGPSKTSDIEQHLVYGAHGAKEVTVILHPEN